MKGFSEVDGRGSPGKSIGFERTKLWSSNLDDFGGPAPFSGTSMNDLKCLTVSAVLVSGDGSGIEPDGSWVFILPWVTWQMGRCGCSTQLAFCELRLDQYSIIQTLDHRTMYRKPTYTHVID